MSIEELGDQLNGLIEDTSIAMAGYRDRQSETEDEAAVMAERVAGLEGLQAIMTGIREAATMADSLSSALGNDDEQSKQNFERLVTESRSASKLRSRAEAAARGTENPHAEAMVDHYGAADEGGSEALQLLGDAGSFLAGAGKEMSLAYEELRQALGRFATLEQNLKTAQTGFMRASQKEGEILIALAAGRESAQGYAASL